MTPFRTPLCYFILKMVNELNWFNLTVILGLGLQMAFMFYLLRTVVKRTNPSNTSNLLQKPLMDMMERMTRLNGEVREALTDRLGQHSLDTHERLDRILTQNRQELQSGLLRTTQALETKFQSLEQQVGLRLENIGKSVESKLNENLKEGFKHFEKVQLHLQA